MRIWSYQTLPYLSGMQFKGQIRELVAIMHDWRDKGATNHLLINKVMEYPKEELYDYFCLYETEYEKRYGKKINPKYHKEFFHFAFGDVDNVIRGISGELYVGWHNKEYLRINMANLYEKYKYAIGKSKITDDEWSILLQGYKEITNEDYVV